MVAFLILFVAGLPAPGVVHADCDAPPSLPDTTGFAAELTTFAQRSPLEREQRTRAAAALVDPWLGDFRVRNGKVPRDLTMVIGKACFAIWSTRTADIADGRASDIFSAIMADLQAAVALDPTQVTARIAEGLLLQLAGESRAGIGELSRSVCLLDAGLGGLGDSGDDQVAVRRSLRRTAGWALASAYRSLGLWDQAESAAVAMEDVPEHHQRNGPWSLIHGLCLAGRGSTTEAIDWAVRMPPLEYRRVSSLGSGAYARPGAFANDWIKSQALLADGDPVAALHVLGDLEARKKHKALPLADQYWQDAGLICEVMGDDLAAGYYEQALSHAPLWFARPTTATTASPLVAGFPATSIPFFTTKDGGFAGGSPFGFIAFQLNIVGQDAEGEVRATARRRALDLCEALLRRRIRPDVVRALRARLYLADECAELARPDLEFAHGAFAAHGLVDPGTSLLLGQQELVLGHGDRARTLLDEAVAAMPTNALAWRELGVALGQVREFDLAQEAMEKGLALDPDSMEGWYNLSVLAYQRREFDRALQGLEKAWALDPGNPRVQFMMQTVASAQRGVKASATPTDPPLPAPDAGSRER
jgi:tetratricopeptide (TPR) repeat protein